MEKETKEVRFKEKTNDKRKGSAFLVAQEQKKKRNKKTKIDSLQLDHANYLLLK